MFQGGAEVAADEPAINGTAWRLRSLEARMARLEENKPDVVAERVSNHAKELDALREDIGALKRALYTFALSITGSAVAFAIAVFQVIR